MSKFQYAAVVAAFTLAGCAEDVWDRPGTSQGQFQADQGNCQMFAMGQYVPPQQLAPVYTASTTYNGSYMGTGTMGTVNGTANTTFQAQPNPNQGFSDLGNAIGNAVRQRNAMRACMQSRGYSLHQEGGNDESAVLRQRYGSDAPH